MNIFICIFYLLQEQELNPRIYSKQELIMSIFYKIRTMVCTFMQKN
jgi:hypothetical protein